jgi:hypothetical protein
VSAAFFPLVNSGQCPRRGRLPRGLLVGCVDAYKISLRREVDDHRGKRRVPEPARPVTHCRRFTRIGHPRRSKTQARTAEPRFRRQRCRPWRRQR